VTVRVDEARDQRPPSEVNHPRRRALLGAFDVPARSHRHDPAVLNGDRLGAWLTIIDGHDRTAEVDGICIGSERRRNRCEDEHGNQDRRKPASHSLTSCLKVPQLIFGEPGRREQSVRRFVNK
jgi:hypothetical protein